MPEFLKSFFLLFPWVRRYEEFHRQLRSEYSKKDEELNHLKKLIDHSRSPGLFSKEEDFLTERLLSHPVKSPLPQMSLTSYQCEKKKNRIRVAERLLAAYHKALTDEKNSPLQREGDDLWSGLISSELTGLLDALAQKDAELLAEYLDNFGTAYTWFGGISTSMDGYNRNLEPQHVALTYLDKLVCLAEYLGVLQAENPETGPWGDNLFSDVDGLVAAIEKALGIDISPPMGVIHTDGLETAKGVFHYRHINALYMASRISVLNKTQGGVCEFGAGIGLTALYSKRFGCQNYTIFDLPVTCILSGHFLIHAVGEENVCLYGESPRAGGINVLPYWACLNQDAKSVEIAVNEDGMPEMTDNFIHTYLNEIKRITRSYFISNNHECFAPRTVNNFITQSTGYEQIYRFKSWTREGYVEECYKIQ